MARRYQSRAALAGFFRRVVLPCRILVASDVRRLDVGMRERTIVSHTPLGFLELPLLACAVGFHRVSFSALSRPLDALPDAEHLRAEAAVHGQDWLHAELDGSMKLDKLRAFAAGLGVQQRDPASGSRLSKSQLLEAVVAALRSRPDTEAWFRSYK